MFANNTNKQVRDLVAQFVEDVNADSVVVMWTTVSKDITTAKVCTYGNQFACKAMTKAMHDEYVLTEINQIKAKQPKPRKDK